MEDQIEICGRKPHPRWKQKGLILTPCIHEPGHEGFHIYYHHVSEGMDHTSSAGEFFEETERTKLKPRARVDLRGKHPLTTDEAATVFAVLGALVGRHRG